MSKKHIYLLNNFQLVYLSILFENKKDGQYYVIQEDNGFSDIAQYVAKYDDIKICTVLSHRLDERKRIG